MWFILNRKLTPHITQVPRLAGASLGAEHDVQRAPYAREGGHVWMVGSRVRPLLFVECVWNADRVVFSRLSFSALFASYIPVFVLTSTSPKNF